MTKDNLQDLLSLLKADNINYYLITLEPTKENDTRIEIFTSLEEQETKNLIKVVKEELKEELKKE